eukprot:gene544-686_t
MSYNNGGYNRGGGQRYGGGGGGRGFRSNDHEPQEDDFKNKLVSLIVRIGDKTSTALESNIDGLANALLTDINNHNSTIQDTLFKCISSLPFKTPIYGTLVGLINLKNFEFGKEIVCGLVDELNDALAKKKFISAKLLIRFIIELVHANVLPSNAVFEIFEALLSVLNGEYTQNKADFYVYLVLVTIPWAGEHLSHTNEGQLNALIEELESYVGGNRSRSENKFFQSYNEGDDRIESLLKNIMALKADNWQLNATLQPYKHFYETLKTANQHVLPPINIPTENIEYPSLTSPIFRLFDHSNSSIKPMDRSITEEYIIDIMYFFNSNHKEAARFLYSLPVPFEVDDIVVEVILGEIFRLPEPAFKEIYYSSLFIDFFKTQPTIIPVFAYAINTLFENIQQLDVEAVKKFSLIFAHHLSNFDYKWIWVDWAPVLQEETTDTQTLLKRNFIKQVLESIVRLSYLDKIKGLLPEAYGPYLPTAPNPTFKFLKPDSQEESKEMIAESHKLLLYFKTKEPLEKIVSHISNIPNEINIVELLTKCVLQLGVVSFSHLTNAIERYITLFKTVLRTPQDRYECIRSIFDFWRNSHQHIVIAIDKFVTFKIIYPHDTIVAFTNPKQIQDITEGYTWEIIHNSIQKTIIIIDTLTKDFESSANSQEKESKLNTSIAEQQTLLYDLINNLATILKTYPDNSVLQKIVSGHLKSITRKYFNQIKPILESKPDLTPIISQYTQ